MSWITWLEARIGFLGIPRLMQLIALLNGLVYLLNFFQPSYVLALLLIPQRILHGEVWRLVSYIFVPEVLLRGGNPALQPLFLFVYLWFLVWMGDALEQAWGAFRVTLYYFLGMVGVTMAAFFFGGGGVSAFLLNSFPFLCFRHPLSRHPDLRLFCSATEDQMAGFYQLGPAASRIVVGFPEHQSGHPGFVPQLFCFLRAAGLRETARTGRRRTSASASLRANRPPKRLFTDVWSASGPKEIVAELEFRVSRNGEEYCLDHLPK